MEALLLALTMAAVALLVTNVARVERPGGQKGLGLFGFKVTLKGKQPSVREGERNA